MKKRFLYLLMFFFLLSYAGRNYLSVPSFSGQFHFSDPIKKRTKATISKETSPYSDDSSVISLEPDDYDLLSSPEHTFIVQSIFCLALLSFILKSKRLKTALYRINREIFSVKKYILIRSIRI